MTLDDIQALTLTLKLAFITTFLLVVMGAPIAWWLAKSQRKIKPIIESLVALPLVLPPSVLGFYLLIALSPHSILSQFLQNIGFSPLAFTFQGLVVGSMIYSMPFVIQPLQQAFEKLGSEPIETCRWLKLSWFDRVFKVYLPLSKKGFLNASILGFAHTLGEFGVVLMVGGSIPKETKVVSIAIFEHVESLNFESAHQLSFILLSFSFLVLWALYQLNLNSTRS